MTPVSALFPSVSHHNSKEHIYIPSVVAKYSQWRLRLMPRCRGEGNDESSAILRRLNWLIERSKIGFKNNPSPFEVPKTQQSVELLKKKEKKLMGGANFRPYAHGPPTLAEDSRPAKHLRGVDTRKYDDQLDAYNLACRGQRLDKTTGYPEIVAALCWDLGVTSNTDGSSNNKNVGRASGRPRSAGEQCSAKTFRCQDLLTLSKEQRNIYLRSEALRRPMFTGKSRSYREGAAWYHGSQLTGPLQGAGRMVSEPSTRNCILFTPYESQECDARLQFVSHRMVGSAGIAAFGRVRVLFRHNGVSEVVEVGDAVQLDSAIALLQSFPTVPKSYTALCTPTLAEVHGEVTSVASTVASGVLRQSKTVDFAWLEVETNSDVVLKKVLSAFPVHAKTVELICSGENTTELVEIFPTCGYIWINVAAKVSVGKVENQSEVGTTAVSMVAFEHFLLTVHRGSLVGYEDMGAYMELFVKSPASLGCPVPTVICSLVSGFVKEYRKELLPLLVDVDNVNEMVLEIQPSQCDQLDLLRRIDDLRHALSRVQASYFAKERVVQRLLLPFVRRTFMTSEPGVAARYQRLLSGILLSIERLRKGRDVLNMSSMSLVSGVSMRLLQHCYWMDYLNNVLTMMTLVSMPVCIIPGLFTMNVRVPFEGSEGHGPFYAVAIVTAAFFFFGMSYPAYLYLKFKSPDALVPVSQP